MDEAVGEPIWSLPPDTLKLTQALPSPGWGGRWRAEFTQVQYLFVDPVIMATLVHRIRGGDQKSVV